MKLKKKKTFYQIWWHLHVHQKKVMTNLKITKWSKFSNRKQKSKENRFTMWIYLVWITIMLIMLDRIRNNNSFSHQNFFVLVYFHSFVVCSISILNRVYFVNKHCKSWIWTKQNKTNQIQRIHGHESS